MLISGEEILQWVRLQFYLCIVQYIHAVSYVMEVKHFFQHIRLPFGTFLSKETDLYVGQLKIEIFFL